MQIECVTLTDKKVIVPSEKMFFRPAAYGVVINDGKVLLLKNKSSGKYWFPGGGLEIHETLEQGLKREVKEEAGIEVEVKKFLDFHESFFYYEPDDTASHSLGFFYLCRPLTLELLKDEDVDDGEAEKPRWIDIKTVSDDELQMGSAVKIFKLIKNIFGKKVKKL